MSRHEQRGGGSSPRGRPHTTERRSPADPEVDALIRAARDLKTPQGRREHGRFLLEGVRLVGDALSQGVVPDLAFVTIHLLQGTPRGHELARSLRQHGVRLIELNARLLGLVADTETPAGIVAVAPLPAVPDELPAPRAPGLRVLVLDQLRDPGNVGGILRTAAAAGVDAVVSSEGSVDFFAPKVVRAGAGAHFRQLLLPSRAFDELAEWLGIWPQVVLADGHARQSLYEINWQLPTVLIMANEAHGPSAWLQDAPVVRAAIPMRSRTESLNVAAAAAIFLYEGRRSLFTRRRE